MYKRQRRLRARIREQLLPVLERDFAPTIVTHLGELARLAGEQELFWSAFVEDRFRAFVPVSYTHLDVYKRQAEYGAGCGTRTHDLGIMRPSLYL